MTFMTETKAPIAIWHVTASDSNLNATRRTLRTHLHLQALSTEVQTHTKQLTCTRPSLL